MRPIIGTPYPVGEFRASHGISSPPESRTRPLMLTDDVMRDRRVSGVWAGLSSRRGQPPPPPPGLLVRGGDTTRAFRQPWDRPPSWHEGWGVNRAKRTVIPQRANNALQRYGSWRSVF